MASVGPLAWLAACHWGWLRAGAANQGKQSGATRPKCRDLNRMETGTGFLTLYNVAAATGSQCRRRRYSVSNGLRTPSLLRFSTWVYCIVVLTSA
jgi:hypothetical protein